jgi:DNA-binding IclR family transcriptional regulator
MDVIRHAADCLDALALETGYMGLLTVWSEHGPMVIRLAEGIVPIVVSINLGSVLPLQGSAAGMIYLAFGHPNKFRDILNRERERGEGPNPARFAAMMDQIRSQGYAVADGQVVPGLASVSAPVFNLQGWPIATINLVSRSGDGAFFTQKNFDNIIAATTGASVANGWQPNEGPAIHRYLQ